jgi:hypothetical protein
MASIWTRRFGTEKDGRVQYDRGVAARASEVFVTGSSSSRSFTRDAVPHHRCIALDIDPCRNCVRRRRNRCGRQPNGERVCGGYTNGEIAG